MSLIITALKLYMFSLRIRSMTLVLHKAILHTERCLHQSLSCLNEFRSGDWTLQWSSCPHPGGQHSHQERNVSSSGSSWSDLCWSSENWTLSEDQESAAGDDDVWESDTFSGTSWEKLGLKLSKLFLLTNISVFSSPGSLGCILTFFSFILFYRSLLH